MVAKTRISISLQPDQAERIRAHAERVRQAATTRQRTTITDHGQPAAVLVNAQELADLEEALALAEYRVQQASGTFVSVPQADTTGSQSVIVTL